VNFLAADLAAPLGETLDARGAHFPCRTCRTREYLTIKLRVPDPGDYGALLIRRPAGVRTTRLWKGVPLGD
jgi:hypothetical protein